jgi:hypothetical protein
LHHEKASPLAHRLSLCWPPYSRVSRWRLRSEGEYSWERSKFGRCIQPWSKIGVTIIYRVWQVLPFAEKSDLMTRVNDLKLLKLEGFCWLSETYSWKDMILGPKAGGIENDHFEAWAMNTNVFQETTF